VVLLAYQSVNIARFDATVPVIIKDFHSNLAIKSSFRTVSIGTKTALDSKAEISSEWIQCDEGFNVINILVSSSKSNGLVTCYVEWSMEGSQAIGKTMISEIVRADYNYPSIPIRARYFRLIVKNEDTAPMDIESYAFLTQ
jgi:hypothetical protein